MIDIHNHSLYAVDDGSKTLEQSLDMLAYAYRQGLTDVILTPHYRRQLFPYDKTKIEEHFAVLQQALKQEGNPIRIYLGCEYHVDEHIVNNMGEGRTKTMAGSDFILMEYSHDTPYEEILERTREAVDCDYQPIIAHVERYGCLVKKPKLCMELQDEGARIQCNANALLGLEGRASEKFVMKLLKSEWVDIIASDTHDMKERTNNMAAAYRLVQKKFDDDYADWLFQQSPSAILER